MNSESSVKNAELALQNGRCGTTEDVSTTEPLISFDFVSGPDFDFASTDDGSQDLANAALMALSEGKITDERLYPTSQIDTFQRDDAWEQGNATEQDGLLEQDDAPDRMDTSDEDELLDRTNTPEQKHTLSSVDLSLFPVNSATKRIEIVVPEISAEQRAEYSTVESNVIEAILQEETLKAGDVTFRVIFTDGREDKVSLQ